MNIRRLERDAARLSFLLLLILLSGSRGSSQVPCLGGQIFQPITCAGDAVGEDEKELFYLVNKYRSANGRKEVKLSTALSMVANRRMLDLKQSMKSLTHSWSNCKYDINDQKTWPCVSDSPLRLKSGYAGQGYETLHNSIILNLTMFKDLEWDELGVAIDGQFAALWFGSKDRAAKELEGSVIGLGISYDQAVKGLTKLLTIDQSSSTIENNRWQGFSPDRKLKLEIYGTKKELSEANLDISIKLEPNQTLGAKTKLAVLTLLKNIFPEWPARDAWFDSSFAAILADRSASRTKVVRKIAVELRANGQNSVELSIKHQEKSKYIEIY